jgi:hypothetical protein
MLGSGTNYETPIHIFVGQLPGPAVLLQAGIHGDEVAGIHALDELVQSLEVAKGKVVVLPRMNMPAVRQGRRYVNVDLNRAFRFGGLDKPYEFALAREIAGLVGRERIEYVLTLHESSRLHDPLRKQNFGQTICYGAAERPEYLDAWIEQTNRNALTRKEYFWPYFFPIETSSTEVLVDQYKLKGGFCVETWTGFPLSRRVARQNDAVRALLTLVKVEHRYRSRR